MCRPRRGSKAPPGPNWRPLRSLGRTICVALRLRDSVVLPSKCSSSASAARGYGGRRRADGWAVRRRVELQGRTAGVDDVVRRPRRDECRKARADLRPNAIEDRLTGSLLDTKELVERVNVSPDFLPRLQRHQDELAVRRRVEAQEPSSPRPWVRPESELPRKS